MHDIGKYRIGRTLGQGGMGLVYECHDTETGRLAAVKLLPQQLASDPVFLQRFKREVMTLKRLDHPNIVKVYDHGTHDDAPYYAMEYVAGISLESMLDESNKVEPLRAIDIIRACGEALQHSHAQGVLHRDIKPANIMLAEDGSIKLMDFGIAKVLDATRMTVTQGVLGTVEYMSPEQSQGRHVDARTDLYSLGVVLYRCLTARLPITGTSPSEIVIKLRTHQIDPPHAWAPEIPKNLSEIAMKLLEKTPEKRVESAQALIRELDRIRRQIEAGLVGHIANDRVIRTGPAHGVSFWRNPWVYASFVMVAVVILLMLRTSKPPELPDSDPSIRPVANAKRMINWASRARKKGDYAYATDLCRFVLEHFPESAQARDAEAELQRIERKKEEDETGDGAGAPSPDPPASDTTPK